MTSLMMPVEQYLNCCPTTGGLQDEIVVANGGDRVDGNVPEMLTYENTQSNICIWRRRHR